MSLAAFRGSEVEHRPHRSHHQRCATARRRNRDNRCRVVNAVLNNGLGRYQTALSAAERATENYDGELVFPNWGLVELIEAAARSGSPERGTAAMRQLSESQQHQRHDGRSGSKRGHGRC